MRISRDPSAILIYSSVTLSSRIYSTIMSTYPCQRNDRGHCDTRHGSAQHFPSAVRTSKSTKHRKAPAASSRVRSTSNHHLALIMDNVTFSLGQSLCLEPQQPVIGQRRHGLIQLFVTPIGSGTRREPHGASADLATPRGCSNPKTAHTRDPHQFQSSVTCTVQSTAQASDDFLTQGNITMNSRIPFVRRPSRSAISSI